MAVQMAAEGSLIGSVERIAASETFGQNRAVKFIRWLDMLVPGPPAL
jgi:hypothetical protein